jgi:hypothetical protein
MQTAGSRLEVNIQFSADLLHSGFVQSAERQALTLEMGVRFSQPEPQPTAAQVHRRFPEQTLIAEPADTVRTGHDNRIDDTEAYPRLTMPLLRSWSARLAEAQEVLVRFQRVAPHAARRMRRRCVMPRLRSSKAEQPVLTRKCVGSSPTGGTIAGEADW